MKNFIHVCLTNPLMSLLNLLFHGFRFSTPALTTPALTIALVFSATLMLSPMLHAQEDTAGQETTGEVAADDDAYSNSYEEELAEADSADNVVRFEVFAPKFPELEETLRDADMRYFEQILKSLDQVKTELNSTYITISDKKLRLDRLATLQGRNFYRADILLTTNYYESTLPTIRNQYFLVKSLGFLTQMEEVLNRRLAAIQTIVEEDILLKVTYELKTLLGVTHTLTGGTNHLQLAARQFEYILGDNKEGTEFIRTIEERRSTYYYLAGIYDRLYHKVNGANEIKGRAFLREKLFYLWRLVELNTQDNEKLKDVKLQDLADRYASIIDFNSVNYKNLYAPYLDKIIERFREVEQIVEESPANPLSGAVPTPTDVDTPTTDTPDTPNADDTPGQ